MGYLKGQWTATNAPTLKIKRLCNNCPKYGKCGKLCADAEKYVSQDFVSQYFDELSMEEFNAVAEFRPFQPIRYVSRIYLTSNERAIVKLIARDLTRDDISQLLGLSRHVVNQMIYTIRKKTIESYGSRDENEESIQKRRRRARTVGGRAAEAMGRAI